jgi:hypothetical protein
MTSQEPLGVGSHSAQPRPPQQSAPAPRKQRNVLGIIALVVAVLGFIFACIPGALIIGWVLLPIAFILGIVSLFFKGKGKGLGIAAIILSIVGTIVGVVVFTSVVSSAVDDALGGTDSSVQAPNDTAAPAEGTGEGEPADAVQGTRDNPAAIGSTITAEEWTAVVNSYTADGNPVVAATEFNEPAPAGSHYEIVNYTVTFNGAESGYASDVAVDVVTSGGNVINSYDNFVVLDDSFGLDELFNGASATGSAAFVVPDGETVLVRVSPGIVADEVFVKP